MSAHLDRRRFLAGVAAVTTAAAAGAAVAAIPEDADAPFFALLRQYDKLDAEWAEVGDALCSAQYELRPYTAAAKEARAQFDAIAKEVEREIFDDEPRIKAIVAEFKISAEQSPKEQADSIFEFTQHVRGMAEADPRCAQARADWLEAKERRDAFYSEKVASLEAADQAAWEPFDAAQRLIITYPVRTTAGLRAKLNAIHHGGMDPQDGEGDHRYSVHEVPSFAAIILADVQRVTGAEV